jgi:hypothetical protein
MGDMRNAYNFWSKNLMGRDHSECLGADGGTVLRIHLRKTDRVVTDWIHVAQDRDQWRAVVKMVMNLRVT